ncbi:MAG: flagellar protein FlgN [Planctomycetota bacterium]
MSRPILRSMTDTPPSDRPRTDVNAPNDTPALGDDWEGPLSALLDDLSATQEELLRVLDRKRELIAAGDQQGIAQMQPAEQRLADRLRDCQQRRQGLLAAADTLGLPSRDLRALAGAASPASRTALRRRVSEARARARLVQHQSLTNWVLVQRTLLHLSQMIEIIATGGEKAPTYQKSGPAAVGGALVDRAV